MLAFSVSALRLALAGTASPATKPMVGSVTCSKFKGSLTGTTGKIGKCTDVPTPVQRVRSYLYCATWTSEVDTAGVLMSQSSTGSLHMLSTPTPHKSPSTVLPPTWDAPVMWSIKCLIRYLPFVSATTETADRASQWGLTNSRGPSASNRFP